jgi:hypothetical protein
MPRFYVEISYSSTSCYAVEAANEVDAKQMAIDGEGYIATYDSEHRDDDVVVVSKANDIK